MELYPSCQEGTSLRSPTYEGFPQIRMCILLEATIDTITHTHTIMVVYNTLNRGLAPSGVHSLYFACIHVRSGPIYWGVYLPCKKNYKVMVFYMETCSTILESPILHVHLLQNSPTMNILDPVFYRTSFYDFRQ